MTTISESLNVNLAISLSTVVGSEREWDGDGECIGERDVTLADLVADRLALQLQRATISDYRLNIANMAAAAADKLVEERFRAVLDREIIPTDTYGTPKGAGQTIAEMLDDRITKWLKEPHGDRYNGRSGQTNLTKLVDETIGRAFSGEIQKAVEAAKIEALKAVAAQVTVGITAAMKAAAR